MSTQDTGSKDSHRKSVCGADLKTTSRGGGLCYHGDVRFSIDPDPVYLARCDQDAVAPVPAEDVAGPIALCDYHLARYLEDASDRIEAELVSLGIGELAADPAFVSIDDAPAEIEAYGLTWSRHSIDQRGRAHYLRPGHAVLELLPTFDVAEDGFTLITDESIQRYFESIRRSRGFAAFDPRAAVPTDGPAEAEEGGE